MNKMKKRVRFSLSIRDYVNLSRITVTSLLLCHCLPKFNIGLNNFAEQSIALTTGFKNGTFFINCSKKNTTKH